MRKAGNQENGFEKARPEAPVYLDHRADDSLGQRLMFQRHFSFSLGKGTLLYYSEFWIIREIAGSRTRCEDAMPRTAPFMLRRIYLPRPQSGERTIDGVP